MFFICAVKHLMTPQVDLVTHWEAQRHYSPRAPCSGCGQTNFLSHISLKPLSCFRCSFRTVSDRMWRSGAIQHSWLRSEPKRLSKQEQMPKPGVFLSVITASNIWSPSSVESNSCPKRPFSGAVSATQSMSELPSALAAKMGGQTPPWGVLSLAAYFLKHLSKTRFLW